jgi:hypothetical protein
MSRKDIKQPQILSLFSSYSQESMLSWEQGGIHKRVAAGKNVQQILSQL